MVHILVVDDDEDLLRVLVAMLEAAGFAVTAADSGVTMREILAATDRNIDAVVLDWLLTGEPSTDLALSAKKLSLSVVIISGNAEALRFATEHGLQTLQKPFRSAALLTAISQAIDGGEFDQREA